MSSSGPRPVKLVTVTCLERDCDLTSAGATSEQNRGRGFAERTGTVSRGRGRGVTVGTMRETPERWPMASQPVNGAQPGRQGWTVAGPTHLPVEPTGYRGVLFSAEMWVFNVQHS